MTNYIDHFDPIQAKITSVPDLRVANTFIVAKTGGDFTTVTAAMAHIASIGGASAANPIAVNIRPGVYTESFSIADYVFVENGLTGSVTIVGKVTATGLVGNAGLQGITIQYTPTVDGEKIVEISGGTFTLRDINIDVVGTGDYTLTSCHLSSGTEYKVIDCTCDDKRSGNITKDYLAWHLNGSGTYALCNLTTTARAAYVSGTHTLMENTGSGAFTSASSSLVWNSTAAFSGTVIGVKFTNKAASTSIPRALAGVYVKLTAVSGGTGIGFYLDSTGQTALMDTLNCSIFMEGFTNKYHTRTALGDTQRCWDLSTNTEMDRDPAGTGLAVITPMTLMQTGFVDWSSAAGNYYLFEPTGGTGGILAKFSLLKRATGLYKSTPVVIPIQSIVNIPYNATSYIYADATGTLNWTATPAFEDMIILFAVFTDGVNYAVTKQYHDAKFPSAVADEWHEVLGSSMTNDSGGVLSTILATPTTLKALKVVGETKYHDNGLDTIVPDTISAIKTISNVRVTGGNLATITTTTDHGYAVGQVVTVAAVTNTTVNGSFLISAKTNNTFSYAVTAANANAADTGSVHTSMIMQMFYQGSGATRINGAAFTSIPAVYVSGATITAIPDGANANFRVGVMPSNNINDTAANTVAQYVIIPDTVIYNTGNAAAKASAAAAAIAANNVAAFPTPVGKGLEAIMLGYITMIGGAVPTTGGTITVVTRAKQVFGVNFAAGSSSSAGSVVTDTTSFDRILSAADTSVQLALATIDNNAAKFATGDIDVTSFAGANNQVAAANVTGLLFANASVRAFRASVSITIAATAPLYESVYIYGIQRGADWVITTSSVGDDSLVAFTITALGQIQYTSANLAGWTATTMKFRAYALPV